MSATTSPTHHVAAFAIGALATRAAYAALQARPPGGRDRWERKNHRGETVTLLAGPAVALGSTTALALVPGLPGGVRAAAMVSLLGAGALGLYDDLTEAPPIGGGERAKGFAGHLGALREGQVTTGVVKMLGMVAVAHIAAAPVSARKRDAVLGADLIAAYANLLNLFDLRPGRAIKVVLLHAPALATRTPAGTVLGATLGAAAAVLVDDLRERVMLGDAGANALGAGIGLATLLRQDGAGRLRTLAALTVLIAVSEKVSFTKVIAATPPLRWADELGRRPANPDS